MCTRCVGRKEPSQVCLLKSLSVSHCLCLAQQTFAFFLHVNYLPPLWYSKPLPPTSPFVFSWRWYLRCGLHHFGKVLSFSGLSHVYMLLNFHVIFFLCYLSRTSLTLRPARRTWKATGKFLPPNNNVECPTWSHLSYLSDSISCYLPLVLAIPVTGFICTCWSLSL